MNIKYDLLGRPLELKKTHDFCFCKEPEMTVVFLHGIASDSSTFYNALKYLEGTRSLEKVRFVTFDLLGSGRSYKSKKIEYNYTQQVRALENSIKKLNVTTPLIIVGHSLGCLIAVRYANIHRRTVAKLILVSPPMFTPKDLDDPRFSEAMDGFRKAVSAKNPAILNDKAFNDSIEKIVKNRKNYQVLAELPVPTVLIYGDQDEIIASYNIPRIMKENSNLSVIKTIGRHKFSHEKYNKIREILEEELNAKNL